MLNKVYEMITNAIIESLESNIVPWKKPWSGESAHSNLVTKRAYTSINALLLNVAATKQGYKSNYWVTFKQAQSLSGNVIKGSKSAIVTYSDRLYVDESTGNRIPTKKIKEMNKQKLKMKIITNEIKVIFYLKYYRVFNLDCIEGIDNSKIPKKTDIPTSENEKINACDEIINMMQNPPDIKHCKQNAYYMPSDDYIALPKITEFTSSQSYYATLFHELVHSTGHENRLSRKLDNKRYGAGKISYSKEELVAEIGSNFLCSDANISCEQLNTSTKAYIKSWIKVLNDDAKFIVIAAAQAQKAANYIRNITPD